MYRKGLFVGMGASAATEPTPSMIAYGCAKASVHQFIQSIAQSDSGLPKGSKAIALLPVILDTPMNRKWMPDADKSTWTPLEEISQ